MPAKAHTLGPGSLKFGETGEQREIAAQLTKTLLSPNTSSDDDVPVLSGEIVEGEDTTTWELSGTVHQDFDIESFEDWCFANRGEKVPFVFTPSNAHARIWTGIVKVRPIAIGGDVKKKNTSDFTFPVINEPTPTVDGP